MGVKIKLGTNILDASYEEQRKRFLDSHGRTGQELEFSISDIHERKSWKNYMEAINLWVFCDSVLE